VPTIASAVEPRDRSASIGSVFVLTLGALDFGLEQSIIIPALPSLAAHYGASLNAIAWLATGFLLASIVAVPLFGRLGDLFGKRRLLLISLGLFAIGSLICAVTEAIELAIAGRVIQGLGAAVAPLAMGIARDTLVPELLPRAIGAVVGAAMAGSGVGFLLSGVLVDSFSPASIFWVLFAFAALLLVAVFVLVDESPVRARVPLDLPGAALLTVGLVALLLAISKGDAWGWTSARIVGLLVVSAAVLTVFMLVERRAEQPLVDLGLLTARPFAQAHVCIALFGFAFFIAVFLVPQIAAAPEASGYGLGLSIKQVGLILLPTSIVAFVAGWVGGRTVDRVGPRLLAAAGSVFGVVGYVSLALAHGSAVELAAGSAAVGVGWGLILTAVYPVVIRGSSTDKTGVAIGVNVVIRNTSAAVGTQVAFAILTGAGVVAGFTAEDGFTRGFVLGAAGAAVAVAVSLLLPGRNRASAAA
jgi:MFS family permease